MIKICIKDFRITPIMPIAAGTECKVEFNPVDKQFWIYTIWGYTTISKQLLDKYFI